MSGATSASTIRSQGSRAVPNTRACQLRSAVQLHRRDAPLFASAERLCVRKERYGTVRNTSVRDAAQELTPSPAYYVGIDFGTSGGRMSILNGARTHAAPMEDSSTELLPAARLKACCTLPLVEVYSYPCTNTFSVVSVRCLCLYWLYPSAFFEQWPLPTMMSVGGTDHTSKHTKALKARLSTLRTSTALGLTVMLQHVLVCGLCWRCAGFISFAETTGLRTDTSSASYNTST